MDERDIGDLARLHVSCLDDSLVGALGARYVRAFYRYVTHSPKELVVVRRNEAAAVVGAAVLSLEPATLNRRLLVHTPLLLSALTNLGPLITMLRTSARRPRGAETSETAHATASAPEIILMFTAAAARGKGHGAAMISEIEQRLQQLDVHVYQVRTVSDPANPALTFYRRRGFTPSGVWFRLGTCFQLFSRTLPAEGEPWEQEVDV